MADKKRNRILELDPEHFREVDGVVFDLDSFARHCAPHPAPHTPTQTVPAAPAAPQTAKDVPPTAETAADPMTPDGMPAPVFFCDPVHIGWYPIAIEGPSYPVMAGAMQPQQGQQMNAVTYYIGGGSGSFASSYLSSYMTSFMTSFATSWMTSWYWGSGSYWYTTSGSFGSFPGSGSAILAGGYGLELI